MILEQLVFFGLLVTIFILSFALIVIVVSYGKMMKKIHFYQKEEQGLKKQMHDKADEIIEEAREKAHKIISEAHFTKNKAKDAFEQSLSVASQNQIKDFENVSQDFLNLYKKELNLIKSQTAEIVRKMSKDVEKDILKDLKGFKEILKKETIASQKIVGEKIEEDYKNVEQEVQVYKKEQLKKVEDHIYSVLQAVSKLVIGRALSTEEHERLIIDALNRAKTEGVIR